MRHSIVTRVRTGVIAGATLLSTLTTEAVPAQTPEPAAAGRRQFAAGDWLGIRHGRKHFPSAAAWRSALARAYFDAPFLTSSFGLLQTDFVKTSLHEDTGMQLVESTQAQLDHFIKQKGGALLRAEAVRRFLNGDSGERQRAQLILARFDKVPADIVERVARSPRLQHRAWAAWCNTNGPRDVVPSVPALFRRGPTTAFDRQNPFDDVAQALRERLEIPADKLKHYNAEHQTAYRKTFLPALTRIRTHLPAKEWTRLDLDGDGIDELFITGVIPDGSCGVGLTLILRRPRAAARWTIAYCRKWEEHERGFDLRAGSPDLVIADFDGDGRPEVAEWIAIVAGWCWEQVYYYDESSLSTPLQLHGRAASVAHLPDDPRPVIVTRSAFNPTGGGKAAYLVTALATQLRVTRWTGPKAKTTIVLVHGNGW
ncbi:MAG: FG-GAP repeat domain-containing protein [Planctomycetota bacterium]|jgi:hypothetical protein